MRRRVAARSREVSSRRARASRTVQFPAFCFSFRSAISALNPALAGSKVSAICRFWIAPANCPRFMSASAFATPAILGGRRVKVVATTVYDEFLNTLDWPLGAAIAMLLLASVMVIMLAWNRLVERRYGEALE